MGETKKFFCTVSDNCQVFIPVKMREVLGIGPKDAVLFEIGEDNKVAFSKSKDESAAEQSQEKRDASDKDKAAQAAAS